MDKEYLEVGKIITTHGIKGELKVHITTSSPEERFQVGNTLYVKKDQYQKVEITSARYHQGKVLITINNLNNINDVLSYVGYVLYISKDQLEQLDNDEFYFDDLIGLKVYVQKEVVGEVVDVIEVPQGAIIRVKKLDNSTSLIPFVNEFIKDVDLEQGVIEIMPIEGLL